MTDEALLQRAGQGDEDAFRVLYERYRGPLYRFAWRMTSSASTAEDLVHDCFVALLQRRNYRAERGSLRTYLYAAVRNLARNHWRDECREETAGDELPDVPLSAAALDALLRTETAQAVQQGVAALPALQREALILFEYEELTLEQIAMITSVEINTVKSRLHRARANLRRTLATQADARRAHVPRP